MNNDVEVPVRRGHRDVKSALLLIALGGAVAAGGSGYPIGLLAQMGPGFYPTALGLILAGLGFLLLLVPALGSAEEREEETRAAVDPRGWGCIIGGIVAFLVLGNYGGMIPATFALVFIAALGDRGNSVLGAALLAAVMTIVAVVIFWYFLGVRFPLFTWGG